MKGFKTDADEARALMCTMPGCRNKWTCDVSHGKVCSHHDEALSRSHGGKRPDGPPTRQAPLPIPLREAVRPFAEPEERDQVEF